jgi:hypothetical protein
MAKIQVKAVGENRYEVTVIGRSPTTHIVTVLEAYAAKLSNGTVSTEKLIEKSFEFLLEREPNTSILRSFELSVIGRYFPEYEEAIKSYF